MLNLYFYFCYFKSTSSKFEFESLLLLLLFSYLLMLFLHLLLLKLAYAFWYGMSFGHFHPKQGLEEVEVFLSMKKSDVNFHDRVYLVRSHPKKEVVCSREPKN